MKDQKGSLAIILVIITLGAIIGGSFIYFLTQQKNPSLQEEAFDKNTHHNQETSQQASEATISGNLKTYTSLENKFSLQYPISLDIKESKTGISLSNYEKLVNAGKDISGKEYINIGITVYPIPANTDLKAWVTEKTVRLLPDNTKRSSIQGQIMPYSSNGFSGYTFESGSEEVNKNVVINENGKVAWFTMGGYESGGSYKENPNSEIILNEIISTFKFN